MPSHRASRLAPLCAVAVLLSPLPACSSDSTAPGAALVATWNATSFVALGQDAIAQGMTLTITFTAAGTYTLSVTGDVIGACSPDPDCSTTGTYAATNTQVTLDGGTPDEVTLTYAIQGTTLTVTGDIDGTAFTATFART